MDYGHESFFTWLKNGESATEYLEWDASNPINNRSANCLEISSTGLIRSMSCLSDFNQDTFHFLLCESTLVWPVSEQKTVQPPKIPEIGTDNAIIHKNVRREVILFK